MGARSDNTSRVGPRSQSQNRLLNGHLAQFFNSAFSTGTIGKNPPLPEGYSATGGVINDFTHPDGTTYRAHIFVGTGTFEVTAAASGSTPNSLSYMIVGAGGGGGSYSGGGGGAGGMLLSPDIAPIFPLKGITLAFGLVFSTSFISGLNDTSSPKK